MNAPFLLLFLALLARVAVLPIGLSLIRERRSDSRWAGWLLLSVALIFVSLGNLALELLCGATN